MMHRIGPAAVLLSTCLGFAAPVSAQETDPVSTQGPAGFYIATNLGSTLALGSDVTAIGANHPTRCDRLLYANPVEAPVEEACAAPLTDTRQGSYGFGRNSGTAHSLALGYVAGSPRFEAEFLMRAQSGEPADFSVGSDESLVGKDTEWSAFEPPNADIYNFRSRQAFLNVFYTFSGSSGWAPYVGLGAGSVSVDFGYYVAFHRKSLDEGYLEVFGGSRFDPDASPEWQRAAAGTVSLVDSPVNRSTYGFQLLGGLERAISTRTTLGLKARWTSTGTVSAALPWTMVRSHRPVHADGQTPFIWSFDFNGLGYLGAALEMRYRF